MNGPYLHSARGRRLYASLALLTLAVARSALCQPADAGASASPRGTTALASDSGSFVVETTNPTCRITINTKAAPELRDWADGKLAPVLAEWYPKIVAMLPGPGFVPPDHITVTLRPEEGVAETGGTHISANSTWIGQELNGEALGALIHEMVHVVQHYGRTRNQNPHATRAPGWLVEGMADYIRWFKFEPQSHGADIIWMQHLPHFSPQYDAGYRVSANFLNWVTETYATGMVAQLNAAIRQGDYREELWKTSTGKTAAELGAEWKKDVEAQLAHRPVGTPPGKEGA